MYVRRVGCLHPRCDVVTAVVPSFSRGRGDRARTRARTNRLRRVVRGRRVEDPTEALVEPVAVARIDEGQVGEEQPDLGFIYLFISSFICLGSSPTWGVERERGRAAVRCVRMAGSGGVGTRATTMEQPPYPTASERPEPSRVRLNRDDVTALLPRRASGRSARTNRARVRRRGDRHPGRPDPDPHVGRADDEDRRERELVHDCIVLAVTARC